MKAQRYAIKRAKMISAVRVLICAYTFYAISSESGAIIFSTSSIAVEQDASRNAHEQTAKEKQGISLLYNPGPTYLAAKVLVHAPGSSVSVCGPGTTLAEAGLVGLPSGACHEGYKCVDDLNIPPAPGGACASYYVDTRTGWHSSDKGRDPGWDAQVISGGGGRPIIYRFVNNAFLATEPCILREIGTVYQGYQGASATISDFRRNRDGTSFVMGQFAHVVGTFALAVETKALTLARCKSAPTAYITADFHIGYPRRDTPTIIEHQQLLGVIIFGMRGQALDGKKSADTVFWTGQIGSTQGRLLQGASIFSKYSEFASLPEMRDQFETVRIDYKALFKTFFSPPPGYTLDEAVVTGFDVYSSVRGANLVFSVKNVDVVGYP